MCAGQVMRLIRALRADPLYDPHTRHCVYGQVGFWHDVAWSIKAEDDDAWCSMKHQADMTYLTRTQFDQADMRCLACTQFY